MRNRLTRPMSLFDRRRQRAARRGAMVVLIAVCLPIFLIMAIFAVDLAYMELVRAELRTATDAAARAGSMTLAKTQDNALAISDTKTAALQNLVAGEALLLQNADIQIGNSDQATAVVRYAFADGGTPKNAVRVTGNRTQGSLSGSVNLFFSRYLGHTSFEPVQVAIATKMERDLALVLDQSGSMSGQRWEDLKDAVDAFLSTLEATPQNELVSLATFSDAGYFHHGLVLDYNPIRTTIDGITPAGYTAVGEGMQEGITALSAQVRLAEKAVIVITDGIHNTGIDPVTVAQNARSQGMIVYTVTFGEDADQVTMQNVAQEGGGRHWHAPTGSDLMDAFQEIANSNRTLITE